MKKFISALLIALPLLSLTYSKPASADATTCPDFGGALISSIERFNPITEYAAPGMPHIANGTEDFVFNVNFTKNATGVDTTDFVVIAGADTLDVMPAFKTVQVSNSAGLSTQVIINDVLGTGTLSIRPAHDTECSTNPTPITDIKYTVRQTILTPETETPVTPVITTTDTQTPTETVLTIEPSAQVVTDDFCPAIHFYWQMGDRGEEVRQIQMFLNVYEGNNLEVDGIYGIDTFDAVRAFQVKYADQILTPWGLSKSEATGNWYKTTSKLANYLVGCDVGAKKLDNGVVVDKYTPAPVQYETSNTMPFTDVIIKKYLSQLEPSRRSKTRYMIRSGIAADAARSMDMPTTREDTMVSSSDETLFVNIPAGTTVPLQ